MKKLLTLVAVMMLSACGVEDPSVAPDAVASIESAVAYCGLNNCSTGQYMVGYSCNGSCDLLYWPCRSKDWKNQTECRTYSEVANTSFTVCNTNNCRQTGTNIDYHYVAAYIATSACVLNVGDAPATTNAMQCEPLPSSGTIEACGSCPNSPSAPWTTVSHAPNAARCTTSTGAVLDLFVCTR